MGAERRDASIHTMRGCYKGAAVKKKRLRETVCVAVILRINACLHQRAVASTKNFPHIEP